MIQAEIIILKIYDVKNCKWITSYKHLIIKQSPYNKDMINVTYIITLYYDKNLN